MIVFYFIRFGIFEIYTFAINTYMINF